MMTSLANNESHPEIILGKMTEDFLLAIKKSDEITLISIIHKYESLFVGENLYTNKRLTDAVESGDVDSVLSELDKNESLTRYISNSFGADLSHIHHAVVVNSVISAVTSINTSNKRIKLAAKVCEALDLKISISKTWFESSSTDAIYKMALHLQQQDRVDSSHVSIHNNPQVKAVIEGYLLNKMANQAVTEVEPLIAKNNRARI